jgi:hypothetical protein
MTNALACYQNVYSGGLSRYHDRLQQAFAFYGRLFSSFLRFFAKKSFFDANFDG